jgi:hypothetical protein
MDKESVLPIAAKIKTPEDELQILAELAETTYFVIIKRTVRRFVELNKNSMFLLNRNDPKLVSKMGELQGEVMGMNKLIRLIEGARGEIAKREGDKI